VAKMSWAQHIIGSRADSACAAALSSLAPHRLRFGYLGFCFIYFSGHNFWWCRRAPG
jgi:hypothetical protein